MGSRLKHAGMTDSYVAGWQYSVNDVVGKQNGLRLKSKIKQLHSVRHSFVLFAAPVFLFVIPVFSPAPHAPHARHSRMLLAGTHFRVFNILLNIFPVSQS
jgi:hypothetical protein